MSCCLLPSRISSFLLPSRNAQESRSVGRMSSLSHHRPHSTFPQRLSLSPPAPRQQQRPLPVHRPPSPPPPPQSHTWLSYHQQVLLRDLMRLRLERLSPQVYWEGKRLQRRRIRPPPLLKTKGTAKPSLRKDSGWCIPHTE